MSPPSLPIPISPRQLARIVANRGRPGLLLDFDGTISELVPHPLDARATPACARAVERLLGEGRVELALVSGRSVSDLQSRAPGRGAWLVGGHGGELVRPTGELERLVDPSAARPDLDQFLRRARELLSGLGALVEDKGMAATAHVRALEATLARRMETALESIARDIARSGRVTALVGKAVVELRALGADKGHAARALAARWPQGVRLVAVGDDTTDEDMFAEVVSSDGLAVKVGPGPSAAQHSLADTREVALFLEELALEVAEQGRRVRGGGGAAW